MMQYLINQVPFADKRRVTTQDIIDFQTEIAKTRAPNTVDSKLNLLSSVFKFAIDSGRYRFENPCRKVKRNNIDDNRERYLSQEEVDTLLDDVKDNDLLYLFTKLAMCTGARVGTLMMIRKEHIKGENIRLFNIKTGRFYMGWIDQETQDLLKDRTGYVLSWDDPERQPDSGQYTWRMQRRFNRLFNQGVTDSRDKVVTHTLRHTVASLLVQNGAPLQVVQKVLDHKSIRSTERYAKLNQDNIKSELNRLWT